jgi:hypothetical protein
VEIFYVYTNNIYTNSDSTLVIQHNINAALDPETKVEVLQEVKLLTTQILTL